MHNGPTNPWSESNSASLRQSQGDSVGDDIIALLELFDADRMPKENIKSEKVTVVLPS